MARYRLQLVKWEGNEGTMQDEWNINIENPDIANTLQQDIDLFLDESVVYLARCDQCMEHSDTYRITNGTTVCGKCQAKAVKS